MRNIANSVSIVTTDGIAGRQGATVSAFCSVSADPPTVLICLNAKSHITKLVAENKCFCLNILGDDADAIATRFAGLEDEKFPNRFKGIAIEETREGSPIIHGSTSFQCELESSSQTGSHMVFIGKVTSTNKGDASPLIYHQGSYKALSSKDKLDIKEADKIIPLGERRHGST